MAGLGVCQSSSWTLQDLHDSASADNVHFGGANRVRNLDLPNVRNHYKPPLLRLDPMPQVAGKGGIAAPPVPDGNDPESVAPIDRPVELSLFGKRVQQQLEDYSLMHQQWVVSICRTMRRNMRKKLEKIGDAQVLDAMMSELRAALQQLCDDLSWTKRATETALEIQRAHEERIRPLEDLRRASKLTDAAPKWATAKAKAQGAVVVARLAAKKDGAQERAALEREFALERQKLLAKVKAAESEKEEAMARASAAEQMLGKNAKKFAAELADTKEQAAQTRTKFVVVQARIGKLQQERDKDKSTIKNLQEQLEQYHIKLQAAETKATNSSLQQRGRELRNYLQAT